MKKVVITAFEPFGKLVDNSSYKAVEKVSVSGVEVIKKTLPVIYQPQIYQDLLLKHKPDVLLLCGQAAGRKTIDLEYIAINYMYAKAGDNEGNIKLGEVIFEDGENALLGTVPTNEVVKSLEVIKLPVSLSLSAGGYVCNMSYYSSLYYCLKHNLDIKVAFIHVPLYEGQSDKHPSLKLEVIVKTLEEIIKILGNVSDIS